MKKMITSPLESLLKLLADYPIMNQSVKFIVDDLACLVAFLMYPPRQFAQYGDLKEVNFMARKVEFFICSIDYNDINEGKTKELCTQLVKLVMPVRDIMPVRNWKCVAELINEKRPKPSRFYYTKTSPIVFIEHLLENLEEMVKDTARETRILNHFILRIQKELNFWNTRLKDFSKQSNNTALTQSITNLAYEVEYAIDSFLVGDFSIWHSMFWLLYILYEFEQLRTERADNDEFVFVGFKKEISRITNMLLKGPKQLSVVSIVGAASQGKSNVAMKVYSSQSVIDYFNIRTRCIVSQVYEKRKVLLELLGHIVDLSAKNLLKDDDDLVYLLSKVLRGRKFLVVLDDMWSTEAWNDLKSCFPNDNNGSKIVFTTRMSHLGKLVDFNSNQQLLSHLAEEESWDLLSKELFQKNSCPHELLMVTRKIAKKCIGIPHLIISTARLLEKMEKTVRRWEQIAQNLMSHILNDHPKSMSREIMDSNYKSLSDYLKTCFLYIGVSWENRKISVTELIRWWIAEGFIQDTKLKSLEDRAVEYLMELCNMNLVKIGEEKSDGSVKSCHVDDLSREFCLIQAREEKFMQLINGYDIFSSTSPPLIYQQRRLCIHSETKHFIRLEPSGPFSHSLLFFDVSDELDIYSYNISFIFNNFKILRILDIGNINIGDSLEEIMVLVLLKYLAVQSGTKYIPSSISHLWNLETFIFMGLTSVVEVPDSLWDMKKLRHVHMNIRASFNLAPHRLENSSILNNFQSISTLELAYGGKMEKMLTRRLRCIRKLNCILLDSCDDTKSCNQFPWLELLNELVSLKVSYKSLQKCPRGFNFPSNLKKLSLSSFHVQWSAISQLTTLRNLEVLKLLSDAFMGETWDMEDDCFAKLKFLKLETLNVVNWYATSKNFPCLEHLILNKCDKILKIPEEFSNICALQLIEVSYCNKFVEDSAKKIQELQSKHGNKEFKISIHPTEFELEMNSLEFCLEWTRKRTETIEQVIKEREYYKLSSG